MASVDPRRALTFGLLLVLVAALAGCQTTMEQNDRLGLRAERTVESRTPVVVKRANPDVEVVRATLLRGDSQAAIAVTLRNRGEEIVNDLPIVVGLRGAGGAEILNSGTKVAYFQGHAPALAPGEETTWVYTTKEDPGDGEAFAKVGTPQDPPLAVAEAIPDLELSHEVASSKKGPTTVQVEIRNGNDIPMYDLDVYAWARKGERIVAAGRGALEHLGTGKSAELTLTLVGDAGDSEIQVSAPATFFE